MSFITVTDNLPQVLRDMDVEVERQRQAVIKGVSATGHNALRALRDMTGSALRGNKLRNSWQEKDYPNDGFDAAAFIYTKAPKIIQAFSEGVTIHARGHRFLAVKTENCPMRGSDGRSIHLGDDGKGNWPEDTYGPLRLVKRPGNVWLLVVDGVRVGKSGRVKRLTTRKATKTMGERVSLAGQATVVMFVLLPQVTLRKVLDPAGVVEREVAKVADNILANQKG